MDCLGGFEVAPVTVRNPLRGDLFYPIPVGIILVGIDFFFLDSAVRVRRHPLPFVPVLVIGVCPARRQRPASSVGDHGLYSPIGVIRISVA